MLGFSFSLPTAWGASLIDRESGQKGMGATGCGRQGNGGKWREMGGKIGKHGWKEIGGKWVVRLAGGHERVKGRRVRTGGWGGMGEKEPRDEEPLGCLNQVCQLSFCFWVLPLSFFHCCWKLLDL